MKPPIGVMPRKLWLEIRIQDLHRAVNEYIQAGIFEPVDGWLKELSELIDVRERIDKDEQGRIPEGTHPGGEGAAQYAIRRD